MGNRFTRLCVIFLLIIVAASNINASAIDQCTALERLVVDTSNKLSEIANHEFLSEVTLLAEVALYDAPRDILPRKFLTLTVEQALKQHSQPAVTLRDEYGDNLVALNAHAAKDCRPELNEMARDLHLRFEETTGPWIVFSAYKRVIGFMTDIEQVMPIFDESVANRDYKFAETTLSLMETYLEFIGREMADLEHSSTLRSRPSPKIGELFPAVIAAAERVSRGRDALVPHFIN